MVLDNGHFGETGMQPSHTGLGTDLVAVARGFGIREALRITDVAQVDDIAAPRRGAPATTFVQVLIAANEPPRALPPRDGAANKNRFRAALGLNTVLSHPARRAAESGVPMQRYTMFIDGREPPAPTENWFDTDNPYPAHTLGRDRPRRAEGRRHRGGSRRTAR